MPKGTKRPRSRSGKKIVTTYKTTVVKSRKHARAVTSKFHDLQRQMDAVKRARTDDGSSAAAVTALKKEFDALGGRAAYQEASAVSTSHFNSSKYVYSVLTLLGMRPGKGQPPLPLLEIGAINTALLKCKWLDTTSIDIRAREAGIQQQDFLQRPLPGPGAPPVAAVVCSMVLNCVTDPLDRGRMLARCWAQLRPGGVLLVGLPKRCILASGFCDPGTWLAAVRMCGFTMVHCRQTPKLLFFALQRLEPPAEGPQALGEGDTPPWVQGGLHDLLEPPVVHPSFQFKRSDLVKDAPPAPAAAAAAAGADEGAGWPLWLVQGVQEAGHLLGGSRDKLLSRVRSRLRVLHGGQTPSNGGDKAAFGVGLPGWAEAWGKEEE